MKCYGLPKRIKVKPIRYDESEIEKYLEQGHWEESILPDFWERNAARWPDKEALVDSTGGRFTWAEAVEKFNRIALALVYELKLERDDRLMVLLPNIAEQVLVRLACEKAGILSIPELTTFRHSELIEIGSQTKAVGIVIPDGYRGFDYYQMVKELQDDLPALRHIIVTGRDVPDGCHSLARIMEHPYEKEYDPGKLDDRKLNAVREVGFLVTTTGSTGMPKVI